MPLRVGDVGFPATVIAVDYVGDTAEVTVDLPDAALCWERLDPQTEYPGVTHVAATYRHDTSASAKPDGEDGTVWTAA